MDDPGLACAHAILSSQRRRARSFDGKPEGEGAADADRALDPDATSVRVEDAAAVWLKKVFQLGKDLTQELPIKKKVRTGKGALRIKGDGPAQGRSGHRGLFPHIAINWLTPVQ